MHKIIVHSVPGKYEQRKGRKEMSKSLKQNLVVYGMVMPAFLVVMLTVAYPIVSAVIQSFQDSATGAFTLDNYMYPVGIYRGNQTDKSLYDESCSSGYS